MMDDAPSSSTIDAWLAGTLSPAEVAALERWFEDHPEAAELEDEVELRGESEADAILSEIAVGSEATAEALLVEDLINRITRSPDAPSMPPPAVDAWREVVEESDDDGILGTLGHYQVLGVIATGGMGIVLKARDPELQRLAALKVLAPDLAANARARERFLREARAAANLEQENILPIYGVVDDGIPWFAMRYSAGGTLQDRLDRGDVLNVDELKSVVRQVASALVVAHDNGIVHRDIKPANLLFDDDGQHLWVCDFGIARTTEDPGLTYPGAIAGTPKFMSPEQADGRDLDGRSDLFSLGQVLYRCATGQDALSGLTTAAVLRELSDVEPTRIDLPRGRLPVWLQRLLENLLARDPNDRPRNAAAVVQAIDDEHSPRPKYRMRVLRRLAAGALVLSASVLLLAGLFQLPPVENAANRLLALRHDRAFFISGRIGAHADFRRAIAAARDGDTIVLPGGAPIAVGNLLVQPGKSLTLVAQDAARRPLLTTEVAGVPGLVTRSPMTLIGVDFLVNAKRDSDGVFVIDNTNATLEGCHFRARRNVLNPSEDIKSRAIELRGNAAVELRNCDLDLHDTNAITVLGTTGEIRVTDSRIAAFYGVDVLGTDSLIERVSISSSGLAFFGQSFLRVDTRYPTPFVNLKTKDSEFVCSRPVAWFRSGNSDLVRSRTEWTSAGDDHRLGNAVVQIGASPLLARATAVLPVEWFADPPPLADPPLIYLEGTDEHFTSLAEAVKRAPDGATLLLSGRIEVKGPEVHTLRGQTVNFRRHPKTRVRPTLVTMDPLGHALFIFGPTSISGIRFARHDATDSSLPIIGIRAGWDADVLVEDCEFNAVPGISESCIGGLGLSITDTGRATVRDCQFRGRVGLLAAFTENSLQPMSLKLEDCVFTGTSLVELHARVDQADLRLSVVRSVVYGENFFKLLNFSKIVPCRLTVEDSIIDLTHSLLLAIDRPITAVQGKLTWTGKNNIYHRDSALFSNPRKSTVPGSYPFSTLTSFAELAEGLAGSQEVDSKFSDLFVGDLLHPPITPERLYPALAPDLESPAVDMLKAMTE